MNSISPRQLARAIGVSEASVKRWVDRGLIHAERTAGGHRRLPIDQVIAFLRQRKFPELNLESLGIPSLTGSGPTTLRKASEATRKALLRGDHDGFERVLLDLYLSGESIPAIGDHVIASALAEIGKHWQCGEIDIFEERLGSETCRDALAALRSKIPAPPPSAAIAVGGSLSGDHYGLPTLLVELSLREAGWNATSLGCNLPATSIVRAMEKFAPSLLWLSFSHIGNTDEMVEAYRPVYEAAQQKGVSVAIGGHALSSDIRERIKYTAYCETLKDLVEFARPCSLGVPVAVFEVQSVPLFFPRFAA